MLQTIPSCNGEDVYNVQRYWVSMAKIVAHHNAFTAFQWGSIMKIIEDPICRWILYASTSAYRRDGNNDDVPRFYGFLFSFLNFLPKLNSPIFLRTQICRSCNESNFHRNTEFQIQVYKVLKTWCLKCLTDLRLQRSSCENLQKSETSIIWCKTMRYGAIKFQNSSRT